MSKTRAPFVPRRRPPRPHLAPRPAPRGALPFDRRSFLGSLLAGTALAAVGCDKDATPEQPPPPPPRGVSITEVRAGEDLFGYIRRVRGGHDEALYKAILGAANEYKEGDEALGIHALDQATRDNARALLGNTRLGDLRAHPLHQDGVLALIEGAVDEGAAAQVAPWTMAELREFLLREEEPAIKAVMGGLSSEIIGMVVKLMTNDELIAASRKVFNPLPGSSVGARGYMGARIQPNSPTDNVDDIVWQVFSGWSYAVGDVVLGNNPVSSEVDSVAAIERALRDVLVTFGLEDTLPHCVLAHIDVQAAVEGAYPGSTALWFQSLGSTDDANATFDVSVDKMLAHAAQRGGKFGLYFETGQGADATNGHGAGFDMVVHEARKYGFARALTRAVAQAQAAAGNPVAPWVHLNDVAGFIGPEVFRTREQLVRCCLEDTLMGKLHGLPIGLDICSTLHMEVDLDDLDWCIEQIMPANPAYLMALPTKNDPMLSYLTTAFQDHVRVREQFGYKVDDKMWAFFQRLGVIDAEGRPTEHFGDPNWVHLQYRRAKGDTRADAEIFAEGEAQIAACEARGVFIARGYGATPKDMKPELDAKVRALYEDAKASIWSELTPLFAASLPTAAVAALTQSTSREDYILHPPTGEVLTEASARAIRELAARRGGAHDVQLVISDGLDALSLTDPGHLPPFLDALRPALEQAGYDLAPEIIVVTTGRVRAGYQIGELLYGGLPADSNRAILHVIGERPGSGHRAYSVYITAPPTSVWATPGQVDHDLTKVIAGIADTALDPALAATQSVELLRQLAPMLRAWGLRPFDEPGRGRANGDVSMRRRRSREIGRPLHGACYPLGMASPSSSWQSIVRKASFGALVVALPLMTPLGGCVTAEDQACPAIGCESGFDLQLTPPALVLEAACAQGPLLFHACVDDRCAEATLSPEGACQSNFDINDSPRLMLGCSPPGPSPSGQPTPPSFDLRLRIFFDDRAWQGTHVAALTIRSSAGETLYQEQREARFEPQYPAGRECGATCWQAPPAAFDVSGALANLGEGCDAGRAGAGGEGGASQAGQGGGAGGRPGPGGAAGQAGQGGTAGRSGQGGAAGEAGQGGAAGEAGQGGAGGQSGQGGSTGG